MLIHDFQAIGNKLLTIRKKVGLTQAEVAEAAGLADRTYADIDYIRITTYFHYFADESLSNIRSFSFETPSKDYALTGGNDIVFSDVGWPRMFDLACELNEKAPETGHSVYFPAIELNRYTINGITYRCYLFYHMNGAAAHENYDIKCLIVPQQESEIAIKFRRKLSEEEMEKLLASRDPEDAFLPVELLSQITLR